MAIKDYSRAPSGQIRAPQLANYGDAFKPLTNHLERLVEARDRKLAAQKEMDFQNYRDTKQNEFLKQQQDARIQANKDAAKLLNENAVTAAETAHRYNVEDANREHGYRVEEAGIQHGYKVEDANREHGYRVEEAGIQHGYTISEINAKNANQIVLSNLNLENSKKLERFKNKLTSEQTKAYGKFLKPITVYSKPNSVATKELTTKAKSIAKPEFEKMSKKFYNTVDKLGNKLGVSYEDYSKNKDTVNTLMKETGLTVNDFKDTKGSWTTRYGSTVDFSKKSKAKKKLDSLSKVITDDTKKLSRLRDKGLTYNDKAYRVLQDKIDKNSKVVGDISTLIGNPKLIEVAKAGQVFRPIENKFHAKQESIKKDAFRAVGVKDYKHLPTDDSPHIDYEATIEASAKNLSDAMANGAPKYIIDFLQKNLTNLQNVNLNAQKALVSKNNTQKKIIRNTSISGINSQISLAKKELSDINKQVAKDDGEISEANKKRKLELSKELKKLNAELSSIKMN